MDHCWWPKNQTNSDFDTLLSVSKDKWNVFWCPNFNTFWISTEQVRLNMKAFGVFDLRLGYVSPVVESSINAEKLCTMAIIESVFLLISSIKQSYRHFNWLCEITSKTGYMVILTVILSHFSPSEFRAQWSVI